MKKRVILLSIILLVIGVIFINRKQEEQILDVNSLNISEENTPVLAMYKNDTGDTKDDQEIDTMPEEGYTIDEQRSYCYTTDKNNPDEVDLHTNDNGEHIIGKLKKNSKCFLYFNKAKTPSEKTLAQLNLKESEGCPVADASGNVTFKALATTEDLLCKAQDDYGDTYYFRGAPTKNWVKIGNTYWQIIRINGNGTIRLIYNGINTIRTDEGTIARASKYYNLNANDNKYVGFMYGPKGTTASKNYEEATTNLEKSTILEELEGWYINDATGKELAKYAQYLDGATGFCNDRQINKGNPRVWWTYDEAMGYGNYVTVYAPFSRFVQSNNNNKTLSQGVTPTFKCGSPGRDLFTTKTEQGIGNGALTIDEVDIPIGLITVDELVYAGGYPGQTNTSYYLCNHREYWTMSPYYSDPNANVFYVVNDGNLYFNYVFTAKGVRPVINLKAGTLTKGTGTTGDPFTFA